MYVAYSSTYIHRFSNVELQSAYRIEWVTNKGDSI